MSFVIPDILIESVLRDGIENIKQRPEILDYVFADLTKPYASRKYGVAEITRIKELLTGSNKTEIAIVHSFHAASARTPCISIQLGNDAENSRYSHLGDYEDQLSEDITDAAAIAALTKITGLLPTAYDSVTGKVSIADVVDLATIHNHYIYVDGSGNEHVLTGGISNDLGNKFFFVAIGSVVDIATAGSIKSFLDSVETTIKGTLDDVQILVGIHTKEPLLTKYLYILTKYILKSRKNDLIKRCFVNAKLSGSDFTRDLQYQGDLVYTRFLTVSGTIQETWRSDLVDLVDCVDINGTPID